MSESIRRLLGAGLLCLVPSTVALAQGEGPAVDTSATGQAAPSSSSEEPAVAPSESGGDGTSIIGDSESPIGLYIIPWRASSPTPQLERPARFVDAAQEPVDETQFRRFVEYHEALTRHRRAKQNSGSGD